MLICCYHSVRPAERYWYLTLALLSHLRRASPSFKLRTSPNDLSNTPAQRQKDAHGVSLQCVDRAVLAGTGRAPAELPKIVVKGPRTPLRPSGISLKDKCEGYRAR